MPNAERLLSYLHRIDVARTYTNWGPLASELEARLARLCDLPEVEVVSASSGTTALAGAILAAAGKARRDRPLALVPAFTFVATPLATEQCGYRPHLVDVNPRDWLADAGALEKHPRLADVGVVVPVAPFGRAVPQAPWLDFRRRTGIPVAIDGGASFEAVTDDPAQFVGDIPVALSFHATKSFSTAEGGCVLSTDRDCARRVGEALNFGFFDTRDCRVASTNGKMSEYHAAVGLAELDGWTAKRGDLRSVAEAYRRSLDVAGLADRLEVAPDVASCYALFRCADVAEAEHIVGTLTTVNIETRSWYGHGLHQQPYYAGVSRDDLPVTDRLAPLLIGLPIAPDLTEGDIDRIARAIERGRSRDQDLRVP